MKGFCDSCLNFFINHIEKRWHSTTTAACLYEHKWYSQIIGCLPHFLFFSVLSIILVLPRKVKTLSQLTVHRIYWNFWLTQIP